MPVTAAVTEVASTEVPLVTVTPQETTGGHAQTAKVTQAATLSAMVRVAAATGAVQTAGRAARAATATGQRVRHTATGQRVRHTATGQRVRHTAAGSVIAGSVARDVTQPATVSEGMRVPARAGRPTAVELVVQTAASGAETARAGTSAGAAGAAMTAAPLAAVETARPTAARTVPTADSAAGIAPRAVADRDVTSAGTPTAEVMTVGQPRTARLARPTAAGPVVQTAASVAETARAGTSAGAAGAAMIVAPGVTSAAVIAALIVVRAVTPAAVGRLAVVTVALIVVRAVTPAAVGRSAAVTAAQQVTGIAGVPSVVTVGLAASGHPGRAATEVLTAGTADSGAQRAATGATAATVGRQATGQVRTAHRAPRGRRTADREAPTARRAGRASAGPCPTVLAARSPMTGRRARPVRAAGLAQPLAGRQVGRAVGRAGQLGMEPGLALTGVGPMTAGTTGAGAGPTRPVSRTASPMTRSRVRCGTNSAAYRWTGRASWADT